MSAYYGTAKAGELTRKSPAESLDLCEDCTALFLDWHRSEHQAVQAAPGAAIPAPVGVWPSRQPDSPGAIVGDVVRLPAHYKSGLYSRLMRCFHYFERGSYRILTVFDYFPLLLIQ
jgi:hypothetical protein